jgi:hypothetical protein
LVRLRTAEYSVESVVLKYAFMMFLLCYRRCVVLESINKIIHLIIKKATLF